MDFRESLSSILKLATPAVLAAACALAAPSTAAAQIQITKTSGLSPDLGRIVRGDTATTFSMTPSGSVSRTSGNSIRVSGSAANAPTVTISCGLLNLSGLCALRQIRVTVQPVPNANVQITKFTMGQISGNILWATAQPPVPGPSLTFDLMPLGILGTGSFTLGMDVWTAASLAGGMYDFDYVVTASFI